MREDRVIPLHGVHNLRDYGGYAARGGARLKSGILYRSGQHGDATPADLAEIAKLNLQTVIDLRTDSERSDTPCLRHEDFGAQVIFVSSGENDEHHAPHTEAAREVVTADDAKRSMIGVYGYMPYRPYLIGVFQAYFAALGERPGASLLHCFAGKDRTGLAAALLHHMLGVHPDDMMADYLLTNAAGNVDRRIAAGAKVVRSGFGRQMTDEAVRTIMSVDADYLNAAFSAIKASHGSIQNYCETVLGCTSAICSKLERQLLV